MEHTLARGLMITGLATLVLVVSGPVFAKDSVGGATASNTTETESTTTNTNYHDTHFKKHVHTYETRVLGLSSFFSRLKHHKDDQYTNREVYDNVVNAPRNSAEVESAFDAARAAIRADLSIASRGQVHFENPSLKPGSQRSVLTKDVKVEETGRTETSSITITTTVGPNTILIGDNQSQTFFVAAGTTNINTNLHTEVDIYRDITTTKTNTHYSTYVVRGAVLESPIVLNMDGSGQLQASGGVWTPHEGMYLERRAMFDFYGNGFPVAMEWVGPADGLLVKPKADGTIDGSCLFGTATGYQNGYEQLASLDMDMDGLVKGKELAGLSVWQDKNGNARPDQGEVQSIDKLGISELDLHHKNMKSTFVMNGKKCTMFDWWPTCLEVKKVKNPV